MASATVVITPAQLARLHAKAWLDPVFQAAFETNPAAALTPGVRSEFGIPGDARFLDLEYNSGYGPDFKNYSCAQLQQIFTSGTLNGQPVQMAASEWVNPSGQSEPIQQGSGAISLSDWTRIYAYIWYQYRCASPPNATIMGDFESDPAKTLATEIVSGLNRLSTIPITYIYGTTPLISIGVAPKDVPIPADKIRDDPRAGGYTVISRYCC